MADNTDKPAFSWLHQPASWIAIAGALISIATFYFVYGNPGELIVVLPDRVGLEHDSRIDELEMLLPITFTARKPRSTS